MANILNSSSSDGSQPTKRPALTPIGDRFWLLRDDLHFPQRIGSKWRKLQHLQHATGIVSLGGAFSNHLHGLAVFGRTYGVPTVGIVRGEHADQANPTLAYCRAAGMRLHNVRKADFDRGWSSAAVQRIVATVPAYVTLPMGGDSEGGRAGAAGIVADITAQLPLATPLQIVVGAGSGTTARGIAGALAPLQHCLAVPAAMMHSLDSDGPTAAHPPVADPARPPLWLPPPLERYAELPHPRLRTIEAVWAEFGILLDPIYSSRAIVAARHVRKPDSVVHTVVVHTGGLQGWAGMLGTSAPSPSLRVAIDEALHQAFAS